MQFKESQAGDVEEEAKDDVEEYKERDLVWAKVKGYSWWPAEVSGQAFMTNILNRYWDRNLGIRASSTK